MSIRPGIAMLAACAVAVIAMSATQASANDSAVPIKNSSIPLINYGSGKCFEPTAQDGHTEWAGLPIQQRTCATGNHLQSYYFVPLGVVLYTEGPPWYCPGCIHLGAEGYFIKNPYTELCLDARDGSRSDRSVVQQWTCRDVNARSMVWYVEKGDFPGHIRIRNFNSDLCLDVAWGSSDEYAQLQQYHCTSSNPAQNFRQAVGPGYELVVQFVTGSDDLRGGNDNVHVVLLLQSGTPRVFENVNGGKRWPDHSSRTVNLQLPDWVGFDNIKGVWIETTFGGGGGGDNWNLDRLTVSTRSGGLTRQLFDQRGTPLFRFTGDQRVREFLFSP